MDRLTFNKIYFITNIIARIDSVYFFNNAIVQGFIGIISFNINNEKASRIMSVYVFLLMFHKTTTSNNNNVI